MTESLAFTLGKPNIWKKGGNEKFKTVKNIPGPISFPLLGTMISKDSVNTDLRRSNEGYLKS